MALENEGSAGNQYDALEKYTKPATWPGEVIHPAVDEIALKLCEDARMLQKDLAEYYEQSPRIDPTARFITIYSADENSRH